MLHQDDGKNLSMKETIVVSQDCIKFLGSPVTCGSQRVKTTSKRTIQKTSRVTGDWTGNKMAHKIIGAALSKPKSNEEIPKDLEFAENTLEIPKERNTARQNTTDYCWA